MTWTLYNMTVPLLYPPTFACLDDVCRAAQNMLKEYDSTLRAISHDAIIDENGTSGTSVIYFDRAKHGALAPVVPISDAVASRA